MEIQFNCVIVSNLFIDSSQSMFFHGNIIYKHDIFQQAMSDYAATTPWSRYVALSENNPRIL